MNEPVLDVRGLHAGYARREVLLGIDLRVSRGEWVALLGANGSGKSSLLDVCVGRLAASAGSVRIGIHSIADAPVEAKRLLGYAIAPERLPPLLSARELSGRAGRREAARGDRRRRAGPCRRAAPDAVAR